MPTALSVSGYVITILYLKYYVLAIYDVCNIVLYCKYNDLTSWNYRS